MTSPAMEMDIGGLRPAVDAGLAQAQANIAAFIGQDLRLTGTDIRLLPILGYGESAADAGDDEVTSVYLYFHGDIRGHCLLSFDRPSAAWLAGRLLCAPAEDILASWTAEGPDPMAASALVEFGNIAVSGFLNGLSDYCHMAVIPAPPSITVDYRSAVVSYILASVSMTTETALLIGTRFTFPGQAGISGTLLLLPEIDSLHTLLKTLSAGGRA